MYFCTPQRTGTDHAGAHGESAGEERDRDGSTAVSIPTIFFYHGFMGMLALNRLMSFQRERRRRGQIREHRHNPQGQKRRYSGPDLPEDILCLIHFLMPLRDAARTACVSHAFLCSWRSRPDITFSRATLGLNNNLHGKDEIAKDFNNKVDHILRNRSGIGLRTLKIEFCGYSADTYSYLNSWLEIAITQQLEELNLLLRPNKMKYSFPCSLLSEGSGNSIRHLGLAWCAFNTTVGLDCLKKLTSLHLYHVRITRDELGCLFSSSVTLEQLEFSNCHSIVCLKLPCLLQRLSSLRVFECRRLKRIEIKAPNISSFQFSGMQVELTVGESMQLKDVMLMMECTIPFACAKLPSIAPNLETLSLSANFKVPNNIPMVSRRFSHLKYMNINLSGGAFSPHHDCFFAASFLQAAPSLETLILRVTQIRTEHDPFVEGSSPPRQMEGTPHNNLKIVEIAGFYAAKSLIELTCYILVSVTSLDYLTLDTTWGLSRRCSDHTLGRCPPWTSDMIRDSQDAFLAVGAYIEGKVPPSVKFNFLGHCSLCHNAEEL